MARVIVRVSIEGTGHAQPRLTKMHVERGFALTGAATRGASFASATEAYVAGRAVSDFAEAERAKCQLASLWLDVSK